MSNSCSSMHVKSQSCIVLFDLLLQQLYGILGQPSYIHTYIHTCSYIHVHIYIHFRIIINSFVNYVNTRYAMESDGEGGADT